jgi:hypothetical protein
LPVVLATTRHDTKKAQRAKLRKSRGNVNRSKLSTVGGKPCQTTATGLRIRFCLDPQPCLTSSPTSWTACPIATVDSSPVRTRARVAASAHSESAASLAARPTAVFPRFGELPERVSKPASAGFETGSQPSATKRMRRKPPLDASAALQLRHPVAQCVGRDAHATTSAMTTEGPQ